MDGRSALLVGLARGCLSLPIGCRCLHFNVGVVGVVGVVEVAVFAVGVVDVRVAEWLLTGEEGAAAEAEEEEADEDGEADDTANDNTRDATCTES